jgi:serine phosphatase RsbU (regulator of sigma subunit)
MGLLVADVADKGIGPALYMALSRTLIRTIAMEYDTEPARVLEAANRRILADTNSDLFVTAVYAVLDPQTGLITYCNAGHNPPFISRPENSDPVALLSRTALPLGLFDDVEWEQAAVQMDPGDVLTLYTDGVVEAQDKDEDFFGQERLEATVGANLGRPVEIIEDKVMTALDNFTGDAPQLDDITLMIVVRDK